MPLGLLGRAVLDAMVAGDLDPFGEAAELLATIPRVSHLTAQVVLSEIGPASFYSGSADDTGQAQDSRAMPPKLTDFTGH